MAGSQRRINPLFPAAASAVPSGVNASWRSSSPSLWIDRMGVDRSRSQRVIEPRVVGHGERLAVGSERQRHQVGPVVENAGERTRAIVGSQVPEPYVTIVAGRGERLAVGRKRHGVHRVGMAAEHRSLAPRGDVPEPDGSIGARGCQALAIGSESHRADAVGVSLEGREPPAGRRVPDPHVVCRHEVARGQDAAVGRKSQRGHRARSRLARP